MKSKYEAFVKSSIISLQDKADKLECISDHIMSLMESHKIKFIDASVSLREGKLVCVYLVNKFSVKFIDDVLILSQSKRRPFIFEHFVKQLTITIL
jgi:hypothetical protein